MPAKLATHSYGKSAVRLTKVKRLADRHELIELEVAIELRGDFDASYLAGDNSKIIATDTMKNTVYALAATHPIDSIEEFGVVLARHFVQNNAHVRSAQVELAQTMWRRIPTDPGDHPHAFASAASHRRTARILDARDHADVFAGIEGLTILKTTDSAFTGYLKDKWTTLPETTDRIFATRLTASWRYGENRRTDYNTAHDRISAAMLHTFAHHKSLAVQQTLYAMGEAALDACPDVAEIELEMPNQHRIPINLQPLGLPNQNEIFVTTTEPYGLIKATVARA